MSPQSEGDGVEDKVSTSGVDLSDLFDEGIDDGLIERVTADPIDDDLLAEVTTNEATDQLVNDLSDKSGDRSGVNRGDD